MRERTQSASLPAQLLHMTMPFPSYCIWQCLSNLPPPSQTCIRAFYPNMSQTTWASFPVTEPLQQSQTSSKSQNHLVSRIKPPAFTSPSLHLPQCLPGTHSSRSWLSSTCPCCTAPVLRQSSVLSQWRQRIKNNREATQNNIHPCVRQN